MLLLLIILGCLAWFVAFIAFIWSLCVSAKKGDRMLAEALKEEEGHVDAHSRVDRVERDRPSGHRLGSLSPGGKAHYFSEEDFDRREERIERWAWRALPFVVVACLLILGASR
jgi:hypothetical protein